MQKNYYVYILASGQNGTLYIGMTNDLARRVTEHRERRGSKFARRYGVSRLVHIETFARAQDAIAREKALKKWNRSWKLNLIEDANPDWRDLFDEINA